MNESVFQLVTQKAIPFLSKEETTATTTNNENATEIASSFPKDCCVYAIAATPAPESLEAAHERDLAFERDISQQPYSSQSTLVNDNDGDVWMIRPNDEIVTVLLQEHHPNDAVRPTRLEEAAAPQLTTGHQKYRGGPQKVTTAASFFGKSSGSSSKKSAISTALSSSAKRSTQSTAATGARGKTHTASEEGKENTQSANSVDEKDTAKGQSIKKTTTATTTTMHEPTESLSVAEPRIIGDVDDFVGDMEEDDDDDDDEDDAEIWNKIDDNDRMEVDDPKKALKAKSTRSKRSEKQNKDNGEENDEDVDAMDIDVEVKKRRTSSKKLRPVVVSGAMDAFAVVKPTVVVEQPTQGNQRRRRRKTLVDKTTVDANGYLHTETQEVWVDVSDDDEVVAIGADVTQGARSQAGKDTTKQMKPANIKTVKGGPQKKAPMKQGNLMGFFQKK